MRRNCIIILLAMVAAVLCCAGFAFAAEEVPQEMQLTTKNIFIKNNRVLEPASLTSNLGTTVVWVNASAFPVEIIFMGKKVALACGSPMNFSTDKDGAFHSAIIPRGATASLCFIEKGEFTYKVESSGTLFMEYSATGKRERKVSKGTIVIE
jgi:plastocyanin